jgi:hypothetical protein
LQVGQGVLEHSAMAGIVNPFELLQNVLPGKAQVFKFALPGGLLSRHRNAVRVWLFGSIRLLSLNRLAFPASRHSGDYRPPGLLFFLPLGHDRPPETDSSRRLPDACSKNGTQAQKPFCS